MSIRWVRVSKASVAALIAFSPLAAARPGDMIFMTITARVQTAKTPKGSPKTTTSKEVCISKDFDARELAKMSQPDEVCSFSDYKLVEDLSNFHETCSGPMQLTGDGKFSVVPGGVHGEVHSYGKMNGLPVVVDSTIDAAITGDCDFRSPPIAAG